MHRASKTAMVLGGLMLLLSVPADVGAMEDDFEDDFWLPFTHYNLGDRAAAEYSTATARSGERSFHVAIRGWAVRDFGSAFGYALYASHGSPPREIRLALNYESLEDTSTSPWDGFASGISIQLLGPDYRNLETVRYITAFQASRNAGRCGPTTSDVILDRNPARGAWHTVARSPAADFTSAPWTSAAYLRVSVGFLCAAGLTGAAYSMYFDDFALRLETGDSDGDGVDDLEENTQLHVVRVEESGTPAAIERYRNVSLDLEVPPVSGIVASGAVWLEIDHDFPRDLSIALARFDGDRWVSALLWDPGFHARVTAILSPAQGQGVRGDVTVHGRTAWRVEEGLARLHVDDRPAGEVPLAFRDSFDLPWDTEAWPEGTHAIRASVLEVGVPEEGAIWSDPVQVIVDRTPPGLVVEQPLEGANVAGLIVIEAHAEDAHRVAAVELWVDGARMDARDEEPYTFIYDTLDLANGAHTFDVRARDPTGNEARRAVQVSVANQVAQVLPPCLPVCDLTRGPPPPSPSETSSSSGELRVDLLGGDFLFASETLRVPWRPEISWRTDGVSLVLDLLRDPGTPEHDGIVAPRFEPTDLLHVGGWRLVVTNHLGRGTGEIRHATFLLAARTSSGDPDTDRDGIGDGEERPVGATIPVLGDTDDDLLADGEEGRAIEISLLIDDVASTRIVTTSPVEPDGDGDGLGDGSELRPPYGDLTDPTDGDTDDDGLSDGEERLEHGSSPTRTDTDGDDLGDAYEVRTRSFILTVNGLVQSFDLTTSPVLRDTDDDHLGDSEEERGLGTLGIVTHPALADTDEDGLNDSEELRIGVDGFQTDPLEADADRDGVWDVFDKLPIASASVLWHQTYPPGLVRFDQEVQVFWLEGTHAAMWRRVDDWDTLTYSCPLVSDDVAGSTKSSVVTPGTVASTINDVFSEGGETRYQAVAVEEGDPTQRYTSIYSESIGACGETPDQFYIEYEVHQDPHVASFVNAEPVTIEDEEGSPFSFAFSTLPVDHDRSVSVVLQFSLTPDTDRSYFENTLNWLEPAFTYIVFAGPDVAEAAIVTAGTAFATDLNEYAYRVELRIPDDALRSSALSLVDGSPAIGLYLSPQWLGRQVGIPTRLAMDTSGLRVASISLERPSRVHSLVVRLDSDRQEEMGEQAEALVDLGTGFHDVASTNYYIYQSAEGIPFDPVAVDTADAILLVTPDEADLFAARESVNWGDPGRWYQRVSDSSGIAVKSFRDSFRVVRAAVVVGQFLQLSAYRFAQPGSYILGAERESLILLDKGDIDGSPVFTVSKAESEQRFIFDFSAPGGAVVRKETLYRVTRSEVTSDLSESQILSSRFTVVKTALRQIASATVLVTNGREAIIAFRDGDTLKGLVYGSNAALGVVGVFKGEKRLVDLLAPRNARLGAVKVGSIATAASGVLIAGYELHQALASGDEMERRMHYEKSAVSAIDTSISLVPAYGSAFMLTWGLTTFGLSMVMPNRLAARITSSPGSSIVFLVEYFLSGAIPSAVAEAVLDDAVNAMMSAVRSYNGVLGVPSVPILP